jgi:hypothetical protein
LSQCGLSATNLRKKCAFPSGIQVSAMRYKHGISQHGP